MTEPTTPDTAPASGLSTDAVPLGRRWKMSGVLYAWVALCLALVVGLGLYFNFFTGTRYAGEEHPIGQQYGVEVIGFDQDADPALITVREAGKGAVTCLLPTITELVDRKPLRNCTPAPDVTTIPAK